MTTDYNEHKAHKGNFLHSWTKVAGAKWFYRRQKSAGYRLLMTTLLKFLNSTVKVSHLAISTAQWQFNLCSGLFNLNFLLISVSALVRYSSYLHSCGVFTFRQRHSD